MVSNELDPAVADCLQIHKLQLSYATPFLCWFDKTILFSFLCEYYNILSKRLQEFMSTFLKVFLSKQKHSSYLYQRNVSITLF